MKIKNPTDNEISIQHRGNVYTVGANESISNVPAEAAEYWRTMIHSFIVVEEDGIEVEPTEAVESPVEVPVVDEPVEIPEEVPVKVTKRTRK